MENCLNLVLIGSVNNDTLPKLGELYMTVKAGTVGQLNFTERRDVAVRVVGNGYITTTVDGMSVGKEYTYQFVSTSEVNRLYVHAIEDCYVFIYDDYDNVRSIDKMDNYLFDVSQLNYKTTVSKLICQINVAGVLESKELIRRSSNVSLTDTNNFLTIDLSIFETCETLATLLLKNCRKTTGSLQSLYMLSSLTTLGINVGEAITGSVTSLFENLLSNGKTGDLLVTLPSTLLFNNQRLYEATVTFGTNSIVVKDSGNNTLGTYNGSTWTYN